jgi:hypothetical protein
MDTWPFDKDSAKPSLEIKAAPDNPAEIVEVSFSFSGTRILVKLVSEF